MTKKIYWLIGSLVGIALLAFAIRTAGSDEFYKGKTIRFVVGQAAVEAMISRHEPSGDTWASIFPAIPPSLSRI